MAMAKRQIKGLCDQAWVGVLLILLVAAPAARSAIEITPVSQTQVIGLQTPVERVSFSIALPKVVLGLIGATVLGALSGWQIAQRRRLQEDAKSFTNSIVLNTATCETLLVDWVVSPEVKRDLARQGQILAVRLYDATGCESLSPTLIAQLHGVREGSALQVPIPMGDRDYKIELGATSATSAWQSLAWSSPIHIPACQHNNSLQAVETTPVSVNQDSHPRLDPQNYIILTARSADDLYVTWQIPSEQRAQALRQGGHKQMLRIHDVTGLDPGDRTAHKTHQYECDPKREDLHVLISQCDRDYMAELGYITMDGRWLSLARSAVTHLAGQTAFLEIPPIGSTSNAISHPAGSDGAEPLPKPQNRIRHVSLRNAD